MISAINWERVLIGTVILDPHSIYETGNLGPMDFESLQHRELWKAVMELASRDALSRRSLIETLRGWNVLDSLGSERSRGEDYIDELLSVADLAALEEAVRQVVEASMKRRMIDAGKILLKEASNGRMAEEILEDHIHEILKIKQSDHKGPVRIGAGRKQYEEYRAKAKAGEVVSKWEPYVDAKREIVPHLFDVDFMIQVGLPATGKSSDLRYEALMTSWKRGKPILTLTLENTIEETRTWAISSITGINHKKLTIPKLIKTLTEEEEQRIVEAEDILDSLPWYIEEVGGITLPRLSALAKRYLLMYPELSLIQVDGMYLMGGRSEAKYDIISDNTQGLRTLTQELHVPIVGTTQFSRAANTAREFNQSLLLYAGENPARVIMAIKLKEVDEHQLGKFPANWDRLPNGQRQLRMGRKTRSVVINYDILKQTNGEIGMTGDVQWNKHTNQYFTLAEGWDRTQDDERRLQERQVVAQTMTFGYPKQVQLADQRKKK